MSEEKKNEVAIWEPKKFAGNDLLPMDLIGSEVAAVEGVPECVGRENIDPDDLILPGLTLLHGTSEAVTKGYDDAKPGRFMHTGSEAVLEDGDLRVIFVHHHKGNALFPKDDERYKGLETCISPDAVEGNVYGECEKCRKCLDWDNENNNPPLGAQVHHFVVLTSMGPAIMRFARSSYKAANQFVSSWAMSKKNLWVHPVVVRVKQSPKVLPTGKTTDFYHLQLAWQTTERVPDELQRTAYELYKEVLKKHETGNLKSQDEGGDADFD